MTRVAVLGAKGRMGSESVRALNDAEGIEVVAEVDVDDSLDLIAESGAEVALDFTQPAVALDNVTWCVEHGVNVVVGTSGFDDAKIDHVRDAARRRAVDRRPDRAQLLDRRRADDAVRGHRRAVLRVDRGHRAAPPQQDRRAVRHGHAHRRDDRRGT